jgi:hypothetical protein
VVLVAALALTAEASEALQRYLTPTALFKTVAAWKACWMSEVPKRGGDPRILETGELRACAKQGCRTSEATRAV